MSATISITEAQIFTALGAVLQSFGPVNAAGTLIPIVRGQVNRVPAPAAADYAVMWPILRERLEFNVTTYSDNIVTGSIAGNVLSVTAVANGAVAPGQTLYGPNVTGSPVVVSQATGTPGGVGTYALNGSQTAASGPVYCGTKAMMQPQQMTVQVDIHGPASADNASRIATQWFDETGVQACLDQGAIIAPLYANPPRQIPFVNDQDQWEERWVVELVLQASPIVTVTQQFADALVLGLIEIDATYPPT